MSVQLGKVTPIGLLVGVVAYCCWPYLAAPAAGAADGAGKLPEVTAAMLTPVPAPAAKRDPFRPADGAGMAVTARQPAPTMTPVAKRADPVPDKAPPRSRLRLNATYLHGGRRLALIDGSVYAEGETLKPASPAAVPLVVERIEAHQVVLRGLGQPLELRYADQPSAAGPLAQARAAAPGKAKVSGRVGGR